MAQGEPLGLGPSQKVPASTFYVIMPSPSLSLLVKAVATRELILPSAFPPLPEEPPDDSLKIVEASRAQTWDMREEKKASRQGWVRGRVLGDRNFPGVCEMVEKGVGNGDQEKRQTLR